MSALKEQPGGDHYRQMKIQPVEFIIANNIGFLAGNIVKYASRYKSKGGAADIRKIIHYCKLILEFEYGEIETGSAPFVAPTAMTEAELVAAIRAAPVTFMHADAEWPADNGASDAMEEIAQGYAFDVAEHARANAAMIDQKKTAPEEAVPVSGPRHYYPTPDLSRPQPPYPEVSAPVWDRLRRVWLPPADLASRPEESSPAELPQPERTSPTQP